MPIGHPGGCAVGGWMHEPQVQGGTAGCQHVVAPSHAGEAVRARVWTDTGPGRVRGWPASSREEGTDKQGPQAAGPGRAPEEEGG